MNAQNGRRLAASFAFYFYEIINELLMHEHVQHAVKLKHDSHHVIMSSWQVLGLHRLHARS